jgi:hypothetical protein
MKPTCVCLLGLLAALFAPSAMAQEPTAAFAAPWPLAQNPQLAPTPLFGLGEPSGGTLSPSMALVPLRLSLQSTIFPRASFYPNCASREDGSGNSFQGFPVQRFTMLALTPNLTLHGFSSAGCPVDGALGGGVTYSVPLRPSWWLVMGGGVYGTPSHAGLPGQRRTEIRLDLMKAIDTTTSMSVGVGRRGVSVGARW